MSNAFSLKIVRCVGFSLLLLGTPLRADVLVVDAAGGAGSDFTDLPAAVASAVEGDIVLVREGTYSGFTLDKGLAVTAEDGEQVELDGSIVVQGLLAGSTATLVGLRPVLMPGASAFSEMRLDLGVNAGSVFVRNSIFRSLDPQTPAVSVEPSNVLSFMDCTVLGSPTSLTPGTSMRVEGSEVFLHGTTVAGALGKNMPLVVFGTGGGPGGPGGVALTVADSLVQIDMTWVRGGKGGRGSNAPCSDGGPGGTGVVMTGETSEVVSRESTVQGGQGGSGGAGCDNGALGQSFEIQAGDVTNVAGQARFIDLNSPVREGETLEIILDGDFGEQVYLLLSYQTAPVFIADDQLLLIAGVPLKVFFLGQHPTASPTSVIAPYVPAVLDGFVVHAQALFMEGGGQLHSSNGHEIVLLSDEF